MNDGMRGYPTGGAVRPQADGRRAGVVGGLDFWHAASQINAGALTTVTLTTNVLRLMMIEPFNRNFRISGLGFQTTAGGAGSVTRVGLYRSRDAAGIAPRDLIVDCGETSSVGATTNLFTVNIPVSPYYIYWAAVLNGVAAPTLRATVVANTRMIGHGNVFGTVVYNHLTRNTTYGALPARLENNTASIVPASASLALIYYQLDLPQGRVE